MKVKFLYGCSPSNLMLIPTINIFIMDGVDIGFWWLCFYFTVEIWRE